jgi:hypothetical protein
MRKALSSSGFLGRIAVLGLLGLFALLSFQGCGPQGPPPEELLAKSWKLKSLKMNGQGAPPPQIMAMSSFNFSSNGRYEIHLGDLERGNWRLSEDKKVLITVPDGTFTEQHIDLSNLSDSTLTLTNNDGPAPVIMELIPY